MGPGIVCLEHLGLSLSTTENNRKTIQGPGGAFLLPERLCEPSTGLHPTCPLPPVPHRPPAGLASLELTIFLPPFQVLELQVGTSKPGSQLPFLPVSHEVFYSSGTHYHGIQSLGPNHELL